MNAPWLAHHFTLPAPAGRKHCAEPGCDRTLNTRDKHARCQKHRRACIHDTIREPEDDWPWWLDYWQGVMARGREAQS